MIQPLLLIPSFLQEGSCHKYFKCSPFRCSPLILLDNSLPPSSFCAFFLFLLFPPPLPAAHSANGESYAFCHKKRLPKQGGGGAKTGRGSESGREDDKRRGGAGGSRRNRLAGARSFVMRRDERGREPGRWRVSCEVAPARGGG